MTQPERSDSLDEILRVRSAPRKTCARCDAVISSVVTIQIRRRKNGIMAAGSRSWSESFCSEHAVERLRELGVIE